jgi:hypothetical protein
VATTTYISAESQYEVSAAIAVTPSPGLAIYNTRIGTPGANVEAIIAGQGTNPFIQSGGAQSLASLLAQALIGESPEAKAAASTPTLTEQSGTRNETGSTLEVTYDDITRPSVISLSITSPTADEARATYTRLVDDSRQLLEFVQMSAGAGNSILYVATVGSPPSTATEVYPDRLRLSMGLLVASGFLSLMLLAAVDALARRRSGGHHAASTDEATRPTEPESAPAQLNDVDEASPHTPANA